MLGKVPRVSEPHVNNCHANTCSGSGLGLLEGYKVRPISAARGLGTFQQPTLVPALQSLRSEVPVAMGGHWFRLIFPEL